MPGVSSKRNKELYKRFGETKPYIVPYHHYSLVMNKKRRMVMWTASNVDYSDNLQDKRERAELGNGAWRLDKRVPDIYQIQAKEFYDPATLIDKGHIARRDDNCWAFLKNGQSDTLVSNMPMPILFTGRIVHHSMKLSTGMLHNIKA